MKKLEEIVDLVNENLEEAIALLSDLIAVEMTKEALMLRASTFQKLNRNTDAINDYIELIKTFGADDFIENQKLFLETIVKMGQLDIYACTNLHNDPWD